MGQFHRYRQLGAAGLVALAAAATPAWASEQRVTFEVQAETVVGTLERPDEATGDVPAVLLLHGFTGSRDELGIEGTDEGVFSRTARVLAEQGIASLRIDFRGSGDSDGAWEDTTFSDQIADAGAAIDWLRGQEGIDRARVSLLGWSQGGLVAAHAAALHPDVTSVTLWAPVANPLYSYSGLLGADLVAAAIAGDSSEPSVATLPWGVETTLRGAFFQELATVDPVAAIGGYPGPLLVIVGTRDTVVAPQPFAGQAFVNYHEGPEQLLVLDTDHVFDVFGGPQVLDTMIAASIQWIGADH